MLGDVRARFQRTCYLYKVEAVLNAGGLNEWTDVTQVHGHQRKVRQVVLRNDNSRGRIHDRRVVDLGVRVKVGCLNIT